MVPYPPFYWVLFVCGLLLVPPACFAGYAVAKRQVSLRFLLLVITVEAVALATFAWMTRR